ncbi:Protein STRICTOSIDINE SYNTHASE-LIKE 13 [Gracilariopsis chorda]|uniref:Protein STRICTOSIDINE SYNTHASE-LIKE 13 n=1 Tax=Gracilariopsis chorda TaxID=448386 RepID=A0A2V3J637_9FLOR|nr:Protein STRICTOSIDINE SYNTHASE-LIKE 13 [Gracilariopsis chorda]|eukprot:PXF49875.1 Protein STRICTOSIDINE SYNTHASE-LIKE 13 [Gracilariopsis chorda]
MNLLSFLLSSILLTWLYVTKKPTHPVEFFGHKPPSLARVEYDAGVWTANDILSTAVKIRHDPPLLSAETAFVRGSDCQVYATDARGIIWSLAKNHSSFTPYAVTGGTLLGGDVDTTSGALYVCDSTHGLLRVPPDPSQSHTELVSVALTSDPLNEITYCDDVHVSGDGKVYFTSASKLTPQRFMHSRVADTFATYVSDNILGSPSGRVLMYDPDKRETTQIAEGIAFANGIAVHPSGDYALVAESNTLKILKVWLRGNRRGTKETLVELPGIPDGVSYDAVGNRFWITLYAPVVPAALLVQRLPAFVRRILVDIPPRIISPSTPGSIVAAIDGDTGAVIEQFGDPSKQLGLVAAAHRCGDHLWLGILHGTSIARFSLPVGAKSSSIGSSRASKHGIREEL